MTQMNVHEAKTHLSRLLERVEEGEEIVIARAGRPIALLIPYQAPTAQRTPGAWRGLVELAQDFDELSDPLNAAFRGEQP